MITSPTTGGSITFMQGLPGSGKSFIANAIAEAHGGVVLSTDEYWYLEDPEVYKWDSSKIGEAHRWNQQRAAEAMMQGLDIIIDNTNLSMSAMEPYIALARIYGYSVTTIVVDTPTRVCIERQAARPEDRRVPKDTIYKMAQQMEDFHAKTEGRLSGSA